MSQHVETRCKLFPSLCRDVSKTFATGIQPVSSSLELIAQDLICLEYVQLVIVRDCSCNIL